MTKAAGKEKGRLADNGSQSTPTERPKMNLIPSDYSHTRTHVSPSGVAATPGVLNE